MTDYVIGLGTSQVEGWDGSYNPNYLPGDRLLIASGTRTTRLRIRNVRSPLGEPPIIIINDSGAVSFSGIPNGTHSLLLQNCRNFRLTGTGVPSIPFGWDLNLNYNGAAIRLDKRCDYFEMDHFEISNCNLQGMYINTDSGDASYDYGPNAPAGPTTMANYRYQRGVWVHDFYIHDIGREGIYFGIANAWQPTYEPIMKNALIERIRCVDTGASALDLKSNEGLIVRHIHATDWGSQNDPNHSEGLNMGRNCNANLSDIILDGTANSSPGMKVQSGRVPVTLRNIKIVNAGTLVGDNGDGRGIQVHAFAETTDHPNGYVFMDHFEIIDPRTDGIRFHQDSRRATDQCRLRNGVITGYGGSCIIVSNGGTVKQDNVICTP